MLRHLLLITGCICFVLGFIGVFLPVLPTTPFLLLATFLFAKSSPKLHTWITNTKVYQKYVTPFKKAGGMPFSSKLRMLAISYFVLGVSAFLVQIPLVWVILVCVAIFLLYLVLIRIPTTSLEEIRAIRQAKEVK